MPKNMAGWIKSSIIDRKKVPTHHSTEFDFLARQKIEADHPERKQGSALISNFLKSKPAQMNSGERERERKRERKR